MQVVEFRLLGPLEAVEDGQPVHVGGRQQRVVLALMLLRRNEVVPTDHLIDAIWGARRPPTASVMVQLYISRLRKLFGRERLLTRPAGYVLEVDPSQVDAARFETLVAEAARSDDAGETARRLRQALALWRGPPLVDFAYDTFAEAESRRLEELRLAALEDRIEADLALGRDVELVAELEALLVAHPFRERLRRQLMVALYRTGRHTDALEVYRDCRHMLSDELGLEPSPALRELERQILEHDPALAPTVRRREPKQGKRKVVTAPFADFAGAGDTPLGPEEAQAVEVSGVRRAVGRRGRGGRGPVIGREAEVAVLADFFAAGRFAPQALALDGEAGIGKTTLFEEALAEARERGYKVLSCRPVGAETAFSFAALADLLGPVLPEGLDRLPLPQRRALSAALLLEEVEGPAPEERAIAFAVFRLLVERGGDPLLVAVDDVQWLDAASASVLAFTFRRLAAAPVAILVARRSDSLGAAPLGLDRAFPSGLLRRLRLGPLSVGATHRLLRERLGVSFPRPRLLQIHRTSGGNPFYALELGRVLEQSGAGAGARLIVPTSLTELVSTRLAALPAEVREVLEPVALLSEPTVSIVEAVDSDPVTVFARLRTAEAAAILELGEERVRFSHPLLAARVEAELDPGRRRALHRRLAKLVGDAEQRARHLALGASAPSAAVADELETASAAAASRGASGASAELAELSVSLTPADAAGPVRRRRQLLAADQHYASGDSERSRVILEPLVEQLPVGAERADVLRRLGEHSYDDLEKSERVLEQAFAEAEPDPRLRAEIVTARVFTAFHRHGPAAAAKLARDSAQVVEDCGDLVLLAIFLAQRSLAELYAEGVSPGVLGRALELEALLGPLPTYITPTRVEGMRLMYADELGAAREALQRAHAVGVARGDELARTHALFHLAVLECRAGEWSRADEYAEELLEGGEQRGLEFQGGLSLWIRGLVDFHLGRLDQARARATEGISRSHEEQQHRFLERNLALLGLIELSIGNHVAAAETLAPLARRLQERGTGEPSHYPARELAIEALVAVGDLDEARIQLEWLEESGRRLGTPWPLAMGARCRGLLEAAEGDLKAALASCERALEVHERMPVPFERARTLLIYGTMLRRAKRRKAAREVIEAALSIFERLPAPVWADNAGAELARIGGRTTSGDALTEGERRIADLVAAGKTNKETAAALFLSVHTVEGALKRVYRKLGVRSRTELSRRLNGDL